MIYDIIVIFVEKGFGSKFTGKIKSELISMTSETP